MKLHLPTRLRKAVVATFVAVTSFTTTLSSSTLIATGTVALSFAGAQALALDVTENTTWDEDQTIAEDVQLDGDIRVDLNADVTVQGSLRMRNSAEIAVKNGAVLTIDSLDLRNAQNGNTEEFIIESGAKVYINGNDGTSGTNWAAATIGHWGSGTGKVTMQGGELYVLNGTFHLGWDSNAHMEISGGTAKLYKLLYGNSSSHPNKTASLTLSGEGRLNIGAGGISYEGTSTNKTLTLNGGTVGALDNWTLSGNLNVQLGDAVTFDTDAYNIDVQTAIGGAGTGSITKVGTGELQLASVAGSIVVEEGVLRLNNAAGLTALTIKSGATAYVGAAARVSLSSESSDIDANMPYYTASIAVFDESIVTKEAGAELVFDVDGIVYDIVAPSDTRVYADASCLAPDGSLTIKSGKVMVFDPNNKTQVAESIAGASKIILDGGTLFSVSSVQAGATVNYVIDADIEIKQGNGAGTFQTYGNANTAVNDRTTFTGALTGSGWFYKTDGGYLVYAGDISGYTGKFNVQGGTLEISRDISRFNGSGFQIDTGKVLRLSAQDSTTGMAFTGGGTLEIAGKLTMTSAGLDVSTHILENGFLQLSHTGDDALNYGSEQTITIDENAELNVGTKRQTVGRLHLVLNGGRITGVGSSVCGLDYNDGQQGGSTSRITVNDDSYIDTSVRFHNTRNVNAFIAQDKTLTFTKRLFNSSAGAILSIKPVTDGGIGGALVLADAGELDVSNVAMDANTKLVFNSDKSLIHEAAITGDTTSEIVKQGVSAITLSGVSNFAGTVRISEGSVCFTQAATLGKLVTDGGTLLVDAAAPVALTLGASEGIISLYVKNVDSIAAEGINVFAGNSIPANANVVVDSQIFTEVGEDGTPTANQYVATYADGKLSKTALTAASTGALTWKVDGTSNNWGLTTGANWDNAGTAQRWVNDSSVTFADEKGESISIVSPVTAASATVSQGTDWEWVLEADKLTITNGVTIAENAALTITGMTSSNYEGVITGAGKLTLNAIGRQKPGDAYMQKVLSDTVALGTVVLADGSCFNIEGSAHQNRIKNITHLVVENGARFDHRFENNDLAGSATGADITIAGAGNASFGGPAAALTFGYDCGNQSTFNLVRKVTLSDDATIWVRSGATTSLTGGLDVATHELTVIGGGTLKASYSTNADIYALAVSESSRLEIDALNLTHDSIRLQDNGILTLKAKNVEINNVVLDGGEFVYHRKENIEAETLTIGSLTVNANSTLKATYCLGRVEIDNLAGNNELTVDFNHDQAGVAMAKVGGSADFNGVIKIKQTNTHASNNRQAIFGTADHDALANSEIVLDSVSSTVAASKIGFVLANTTANLAETIQIAGISTGSGIDVAKAVIVSQDGVSIASDGDNRTLEILGSGSYEFNGTMLIGVSLLMNGSGTQSFAGNLDAFNGSIEVQKGTLNLAKVANTSGITLAGAGATLGVTDGVSGKSLTAKAVGAVLNADLTLSQGSVAFGTDTSAWAATGGLSLANHKLVLDAGNKAALAANLTGLEAGSVVELFTNVGALNDAAGNALSLADTARVSDYFSAADSTLGGYLLNWSDGKLSLVMKDELKDLVWDDASTENTWQSTAGLTNWTNTATDASTFFSIADSVTFAGQGETVSIVGTVKPMDVDVEAGTYEWDGSGSVEASGTLTVGSDTSAANLTIGNSGNKSFAGGIELKNGSVLTVTDNTGWSGTATGEGVLKLQTGKDVGDLTQYVAVPTEEAPDKLGTLEVSGSGTALTLSSAALAAPTAGINDLRVSDAGVLNLTENVTVDTGVMVSAYDGAITVASGKTATIADLLYTYGTMTKNGDGTLVLAGHADTYGNTENANANDDANGQTIIAAGTLKIDDNAPTDVPNYIADISTYDLGDVSGAGTLLLSNGSVVANSVADTLTVNVATEAAGDVVELSGVQGSSLDSISLAAGTQLKGAMGDITVGGTDNVQSMVLTLDEVNVGTSSTIAADKKAMIDQTDAAKLIINEGASVEMGIDAVVATLKAAATNESDVYLHLTTGTLEYVGDVVLDYTEANVSVELMENIGVRETGIVGGSIRLSGGAQGIYVSSVNGNYVESDELGTVTTKQATVVSQDDTLTLQLDGVTMTDPARINNLLGATGSTLALENTSADMIARVELRNKLQQIDNPEPAEATGADTYMAGDIDGTAGAGEVEVIISGPGTLTVGGNLTTALLTMQEGGLTLDGDANEVDYLGDGVIDPAAEQPVLTVNGKLTVAGESAVFSTKIAGDGTLVLEDNLNVADNAKLAGVGIELQKTNFGTEGSLSLDGVQDAEVSALSGNGILQGKDATLTVTGQGGSFSGTLTAIDTTAPGTNVLAVAQGGSQTLDRVNGSRDWSVENAGELIINITNPAVTTGTGTNKTLTLDSLTAKSGSLTTLVINSDAPGTYLDLNSLVLENGATVAVNSTGLDEVDFGGSITLARTANGVTLGDDVAVDLVDCIAFKKVREAWLETDGKVLTLQTEYHDENQYAKMAASENAMAGATMLWSVNTGALPNASPLKSVDEAVNALSKLGTAEAAAEGDRIMAAVAGSSTAILGSALASDVERQLRAIRNRTTTMGVSQAAVNEYMPYYNAWINAEGDHHEVDADGMAPGYTRDSWGGTVGFDVDVTPSFTMGLAVTAMYGDVESQGPDKLDGDFDTQYLSLFARYTHNAWTHTFVATVGRADISMERTVNYGTGRYTAEGETEGMALGFMYEVGRVYSLTESGDVCLQPVFNVSLRQSTVDGYEETACDAGVAVDDQTATTLTFGAGARMQAVIGTSLYNRATILEARALVKFDAGDREGEADVRLLQGGAGSTVKSAELGAFGAEIGMGVTIPMGSDAGSVFVDGSLEVRSGYTNINGTVGYRVNF